MLFLATFVRSAIGFGEALVAVPILALIIPIQVAAPVAVLISITVAAVVLVGDWRHVHLRSASRLILSTLIGTPLGLLLLTRISTDLVKACLGLAILAFSCYSLARHRLAKLQDDRLAWAFGFSAGVLGGAYGMNGPPLAVYGTLRGWSAQSFRATLQGYFLPASMMSMAGYWAAGLWNSEVTHYYLASLPGVAVAMFLGRLSTGRMDTAAFLRWVNVALIVVAGVLLVQAFWNQRLG
ncbi:MAG TPA: sulfite exporter TauE/SafE family protein [Steroidobacteraceae bacterium]